MQVTGTGSEQRSAESPFGRRTGIPARPREQPDAPVPRAEPAPLPPPLPRPGSGRTNSDKAGAEGAGGASPGPVLQPLAGVGETGGELAMEGAHGAAPLSRPAAAGSGLSLSAHEGRTAPATTRPRCREAGREAGREGLDRGRATPLERGDPRGPANWGFAATEPDQVPLSEQSTGAPAAVPARYSRCAALSPFAVGAPSGVGHGERRGLCRGDRRHGATPTSGPDTADENAHESRAFS